jgi:hypothetical protein
MLLKSHVIMALLVSLSFTVAAASGWRMFPVTPRGTGVPSGYSTGGGHFTGGGYHSTWHGGK